MVSFDQRYVLQFSAHSLQGEEKADQLLRACLELLVQFYDPVVIRVSLITKEKVTSASGHLLVHCTSKSVVQGPRLVDIKGESQ